MLSPEGVRMAKGEAFNTSDFTLLPPEPMTTEKIISEGYDTEV